MMDAWYIFKEWWLNTAAWFDSEWAPFWLLCSTLLSARVIVRWLWRGMLMDVTWLKAMLHPARALGVFARKPQEQQYGPLERVVADENGRPVRVQARRDPVTGEPVSWSPVTDDAKPPPRIIRAGQR